MSILQNIYTTNLESLISSYNENPIEGGIPEIDDFILALTYKDENHLLNNTKFLIKKFNLELYLQNRYKDSVSHIETIYRIKHHIDNRPKCRCGRDVRFWNFANGYANHCSSLCSKTDPIVIGKNKKTCLERYGVDNVWKSSEIKDKIKETCLERYGVEYASQSSVQKEHMKETFIKNYGVDNPWKAEEIKDKIKETCLERYGVENVYASKEIQDKIKNTLLEKYGVEHPILSEQVKNKMKQTCLERFGSEFYAQSQDYKDKVSLYMQKTLITKKRKNSYAKSNKEDDCFNLLKEVYGEVLRQYYSEEYPYRCDFYIPSINQYIEYNGLWTHGPHPFNQNNEDDINLVNYWKSKNTKYYNSAIKVWTIGDPKKRKTAKCNNLNFLEVWTIEELKMWINENRPE